MNRLKLLAALTAIVLFTSGAVGLWASGTQEIKLKKNKINIGVVHITFESSYFFNGVQYQSFDRSYRRELDRIGRENNVNFIHVEGGMETGSAEQETHTLLDLGVDGIVIFQHDPGTAFQLAKEVQAAGIPVLVHGIRLDQFVPVPYVGFDEYGTNVDLGKAVAQQFLKTFPSEKAKVLVLNSRTFQGDIYREQGFTAGFRSVVPDAEFLNQVQDTGDEQRTMQIVSAALLDTPQVNVIYATNDLRAQGAMSALSANDRTGAKSSVILAAVGGTSEAMQELLKPDSPLKAEVGLAIRDVAKETYRVMIGMIKGEIPKRQDKWFLVKSPVFVQPTKQQVQQYLSENHDEQLP
jgi:ABC-type sugar transport system substrate-binding protein